MEFSPLLKRQLVKVFGEDFDIENLDQKMLSLLNLVDRSYANIETERERTKRTFKIVDSEFRELLERLETELEEKEKGFVIIRDLIYKLDESQNLGFSKNLGDKDLIRIMQLAVERKIQLQTQLQSSMQMIQEQATQKSDFLSFMSHEIRTPLNMISGIVGILHQNEKLEEQRENIENLYTITNRTVELVNDVLDFQKLDEGSSKILNTPVKIFNLFDVLVEDFKPLAAETENKISLKYQGKENTCVRMDAFRVRQVASNLISNALKFTKKGRIQVHLEEVPLGDGLVKFTIWVKDNGQGMSEEQVNSLFTKFSNSQQSLSSNISGSGLGLYFSNKLLEAMDSEIKVKSIEGVGSEFSFSFITHFDQCEQHKNQNKMDIKVSLKGKNILVAEDFEMNQKIIRKVLENEGVNCTIVDNGFEVLEKVQDNDYDAILMDVNMPGMDGIETAHKVQQMKGMDVIIIPLTADLAEEKQNMFKALGITDVIMKPYKFEDLLKILDTKLNGEPV